jgi:hypothetical protein|tara:strand:+ start:847 stop:1515 length:669 start_codon:yes stop_codon:yes gene_type:complete
MNEQAKNEFFLGFGRGMEKVKKRRSEGTFNKRAYNDGFTVMEKAFIDNYLVCFNASKSARLAGYKDCDSKGWKVLRLPHIRDEIDIRIEEREKRLRIEADDVLREYMRIAFFDPAVLYDQNDNFVGMKNLNPQQRSMVKSLKKHRPKDSQEITVVETYDKMQALEKCALHLGMMLPKTQIDITENKMIEIQIKKEELKKLGVDRLLEINKLLSEEPEGEYNN